MNEARTDNSKGLSPGSCPAGKQRGPGHHQKTARKRWAKEEKKRLLSCYITATRMYKANV